MSDIHDIQCPKCDGLGPFWWKGVAEGILHTTTGDAGYPDIQSPEVIDDEDELTCAHDGSGMEDDGCGYCGPAKEFKDKARE